MYEMLLTKIGLFKGWLSLRMDQRLINIYTTLPLLGKFEKPYAKVPNFIKGLTLGFILIVQFFHVFTVKSLNKY